MTVTSYMLLTEDTKKKRNDSIIFTKRNDIWSHTGDDFPPKNARVNTSTLAGAFAIFVVSIHFPFSMDIFKQMTD